MRQMREYFGQFNFFIAKNVLVVSVLRGWEVVLN